MNILNFSENIIRLRRERKITQEELADFIGVTKASVSKWENKQSLPDILLLPQLASFFDVTVDELLGYEAQLSKEQIQKEYVELATDFANLPFEEVHSKIRKLVRRYYSCYPLLLQLCVLYLNHYMVADTPEQGKSILLEAASICDHIINNCSEVTTKNDAVALKAVFNLQQGNAKEVIDVLEPVTDPSRMSGQNDTLLIQAYQMIGEMEKAKSFTQVTMYQHLLYLIGSSIQYLGEYMNDLEVCKETICRIEGIIDLYKLRHLHANVTAQFYFQAALVFAANGELETALEKLQQYEKSVCDILSQEHILLHGDAYFDRIDEWIDKLALGSEAPRNKQLIRQSALQGLSHPLFTSMQNIEEFKRIQRHLSEGVK